MAKRQRLISHSLSKKVFRASGVVRGASSVITNETFVRAAPMTLDAQRRVAAALNRASEETGAFVSSSRNTRLDPTG